MEFVDVTNDEKTFSFRVQNNAINFASVKTFFDSASSLTYEFEGKTCGVDIQNDMAEVVPGIQKYKVFSSPKSILPRKLVDKKYRDKKVIIFLKH